MRPSSFFVGAGRRVPVMWVLAIDCPLAVDGGGAVLVGWVVIGMWVVVVVRPFAYGKQPHELGHVIVSDMVTM